MDYFSALFSGGMKNKWPARAYVDLFSGPGICRNRETGGEFHGSALRAMACPTPFTHLFFNDIDDDFIGALKSRQEQLHPTVTPTYSTLDCNEATREIREKLPANALVLAFVDPWLFEITFSGLAALAERPSVDLIITFHTTPIKRNAHQDVAAVDRFLDDEDWRERYFSAVGNPSNPPTRVLIDGFRSRLRERLGYTYFGTPARIPTSGSTMFYLLFASRHHRSLDFWQKSLVILPSGQRTMFRQTP